MHNELGKNPDLVCFVLVGLDLLLTGLAMIILASAMKRVRSSGYVDTISL